MLLLGWLLKTYLPKELNSYPPKELIHKISLSIQIYIYYLFVSLNMLSYVKKIKSTGEIYHAEFENYSDLFQKENCLMLYVRSKDMDYLLGIELTKPATESLLENLLGKEISFKGGLYKSELGYLINISKFKLK